MSLLDSFHQNFRSSLSFHAILSVLNALPCLPPFFFFFSEVFPNFRSSQQETQTFPKTNKLFLESVGRALCTLALLCLFTSSMYRSLWEGQKMTCSSGSYHSPSSLQVSGIELKLSGFGVSALTCLSQFALPACFS